MTDAWRLGIGAAAIVATGLVVVARQNPPERNTLGQPRLSSPGVVREDAWVPAAGLEQVSRAYARIIGEVNELDRKDVLPGRPAAPPGAQQEAAAQLKL